jgi:hypothetical protein
VLGLPVADMEGRHLGRVVAVDCAPDPYSVAWFVVRLWGWRRHVRAVPARRAVWLPLGGLGVPYLRPDVLASPALSEDGLHDLACRRAIEAFYAAVPVA